MGLTLRVYPDHTMASSQFNWPVWLIFKILLLIALVPMSVKSLLGPLPAGDQFHKVQVCTMPFRDVPKQKSQRGKGRGRRGEREGGREGERQRVADS